MMMFSYEHRATLPIPIVHHVAVDKRVNLPTKMAANSVKRC